MIDISHTAESNYSFEIAERFVYSIKFFNFDGTRTTIEHILNFLGVLVVKPEDVKDLAIGTRGFLHLFGVARREETTLSLDWQIVA